MSRRIKQNKLTSEELLAKVLEENKTLQEDFMKTVKNTRDFSHEMN